MTWLLGATFLFIQINEYVHIGFSARDGAFGSIFYGLTGLHGAHVFVGLMLLTFANIRAWRGHFGPEAQGPPRRRGARHLLALRRRDVDHRLHASTCCSDVAFRARRSGRRERRASSQRLPADAGKSMRLRGHLHPSRSDEPAGLAARAGRLFSVGGWVDAVEARAWLRLGAGCLASPGAATLELVGVAQRPADPLDEQVAGGLGLDVGGVDPLAVDLGARRPRRGPRS